MPSVVTSVIMAMMVEFAQRMLTNLPTVPRTSDIGICPEARRPTRASEPRTEITRPKELTMLPGMSRNGSGQALCGTVLGQTVKPPRRQVVQIRHISAYGPLAAFAVCRDRL